MKPDMTNWQARTVRAHAARTRRVLDEYLNQHQVSPGRGASLDSDCNFLHVVRQLRHETEGIFNPLHDVPVLPDVRLDLWIHVDRRDCDW